MNCERIILFFCLHIIIQLSNSLNCKDENNNDTDWFIVYKIPLITSSHKSIDKGVGYIYITSKDYESWKFSNQSIADNSSIIGNTLRDFYHNKTHLSYILYNDEPPNHSISNTKGHTKGVVIANSTGGFWLVHSVPKFPDVGYNYGFPSNGIKNGQTFICISMNLTNINTVGLQLQYNEPFIYLQSVTSDLASVIPEFAKAAKNVTIKTAPWSHVVQLYSKNHVPFVSFAKTKKFNQELYEDLVAPYFKNDLEVETWPNGPGRLKSNCSKEYKVYNIKSVNMTISNASFTTTKDHSKWAVSARSSNRTWSCVGDINRAEHQEVRGGGTVCLNNRNVTTNFQKLISGIEDCSPHYDFWPTVINL